MLCAECAGPRQQKATTLCQEDPGGHMCNGSASKPPPLRTRMMHATHRRTVNMMFTTAVLLASTSIFLPRIEASHDGSTQHSSTSNKSEQSDHDSIIKTRVKFFTVRIMLHQDGDGDDDGNIDLDDGEQSSSCRRVRGENAGTHHAYSKGKERDRAGQLCRGGVKDTVLSWTSEMSHADVVGSYVSLQCCSDTFVCVCMYVCVCVYIYIYIYIYYVNL
jgi:hypothetical protein